MSAKGNLAIARADAFEGGDMQRWMKTRRRRCRWRRSRSV